ncbi:MAG: hypothetical protein K9J48_05260 [Desulfohalobiaceae bacterium]|nr:hypothetical protein [Desulfohalobiaceae bacterium]
MNIQFRHTAALFLVFGLLLAYGCAGTTTVTIGDPPEQRGHEQRTQENRGPHKKGPPPWAPAHGHRAKHRYRYYPSAEVYFDVNRDIYFYYQNGQWRTSVGIPGNIRVQLGDSVTLEMNTKQPYEYHSEVIQRYPPGLRKERGKDKGKGWKD